MITNMIGTQKSSFKLRKVNEDQYAKPQKLKTRVSKIQNPEFQIPKAIQISTVNFLKV